MLSVSTLRYVTLKMNRDSRASWLDLLSLMILPIRETRSRDICFPPRYFSLIGANVPSRSLSLSLSHARGNASVFMSHAWNARMMSCQKSSSRVETSRCDCEEHMDDSVHSLIAAVYTTTMITTAHLGGEIVKSRGAGGRCPSRVAFSRIPRYFFRD